VRACSKGPLLLIVAAVVNIVVVVVVTPLPIAANILPAVVASPSWLDCGDGGIVVSLVSHACIVFAAPSVE